VRTDYPHTTAVATLVAACRRRLPWVLFAAGACGCVIAGCATETGQQDSVALNPKPMIPLPQQTLLTQQPEPNCVVKMSQLPRGEVRAQEFAKSSTRVANLAVGRASDGAIAAQAQPPTSAVEPQQRPSVAQSDPNAGLGLRIKLEHERDCYQSAEVRARERLRLLQAAVKKTIIVVKRIERGDR